MELLHEEWFWAMLALLITPVIFILETHAQNKISRADFVFLGSHFGQAGCLGHHPSRQPLQRGKFRKERF